MSTDIHLTIEYRKRLESYDPEDLAHYRRNNPAWLPAWDVVADCWPGVGVQCAAEFRLDRDYYLFMLMAGARRHRFPEDVTLFEPRGLPADASEEARNWIKRRMGDWHTASWLTLVELKEVYRVFGETGIEIDAFLRFKEDEEIVVPEGWAELPDMRWTMSPEKNPGVDFATAIMVAKTVPRKDAPRSQVPVITDLDAIIAMMEVYERDGDETRVVFAFDN